MIRSVFLIGAGMLLAGWGLWNGFNKEGTRAILGAAVAVLGLSSALVGTLLWCVPYFFSR